MKTLSIAILLTLCAMPVIAQGSKFNLNCDKGEKINKLLSTLAKTGASSPITINVSGTCKESVSVEDFDRVTLVAKNGAVIIGQTNPAVAIARSHFVALEGFLIRKGLIGVLCSDNSVCDLSGLTVENASNEGIRFARSEGAVNNCVAQNNGFRGVNAVNGSSVLVFWGTSQGNADAGIAAVSGSQVTIQNVTVQNNGGEGVAALLGSSVRLFDNTITGNGGDGVGLFAQANGSLEQVETGNVVTGNLGVGIFLRDLSFVRFLGANNVTGNITQPDIACAPQFAASRGAATAGGTTDCAEPTAATERPAPELR